MELKGPSGSADMAVLHSNAVQSFSEINTFTSDTLSATGLTEEGFNVVKRTIEAETEYTSRYTVTEGPVVFVQNNDYTNSVDVLSGLACAGDIIGDNVYNAVWNDLVDCIAVSDDLELEYGKCYIFDGQQYKQSSAYAEDGIIGVHSDTAGFIMGAQENKKCLHTAVAGFALVYVDKEYPVGTPLTCTANGYLTEFKIEDLEKAPHKMVATFWKKEWSNWWGFNRPISAEQIVEVKDRMWVKVVR